MLGMDGCTEIALQSIFLGLKELPKDTSLMLEVLICISTSIPANHETGMLYQWQFGKAAHFDGNIRQHVDSSAIFDIIAAC